MFALEDTFKGAIAKLAGIELLIEDAASIFRYPIKRTKTIIIKIKTL